MSRTMTLVASAAMLASTLTLAAGTTTGASAAKGWDRQAPTNSAANPDAARRLKCRAHMSDSTPEQYSNVYVKVRTAKRAKVHTVAKYKTTKTHKNGRANKKGRARIKYYISGASPRYRVKVDVTVKKRGKTRHCSTSFRPHR